MPRNKKEMERKKRFKTRRTRTAIVDKKKYINIEFRKDKLQIKAYVFHSNDQKTWEQEKSDRIEKNKKRKTRTSCIKRKIEIKAYQFHNQKSQFTRTTKIKIKNR